MLKKYNNISNKLFLGLLLTSNISVFTIHTEQVEEVIEQQIQVSSEIEDLNSILDSNEPMQQSNPSNPASYTPAWVKNTALRVLSGYCIARDKMIKLFKKVKVTIAKR